MLEDHGVWKGLLRLSVSLSFTFSVMEPALSQKSALIICDSGKTVKHGGGGGG